MPLLDTAFAKIYTKQIMPSHSISIGEKNERNAPNMAITPKVLKQTLCVLLHLFTYSFF